MGSVIYDFLSESFLFSPSHQDDYYASFSEADLRKELESYRLHAITSINDLGDEISGYKSQLKIFGAQDYFSIPHLMQTALYLDQVILPDPIFPFTKESTETSNAMSQMIGVSPTNQIDREGLASAAKKMKCLTPMVTANYIKFFPVSYFAEPGEEIPFSYSEKGYSDVLPSEILSKYRESAEVRSLLKSPDGLVVKDELELGRGIAVQFIGDNDELANIYHLHEQEVVNVDDGTNVIHVKYTLPDSPPTVEMFNAWVSQSINQSAIGHYELLLKDMSLSHRFGASFLTASEFTHSLLGSNASKKDIKGFTSNCVLNLNLPFLENISMQDLMSVRTNDGEAFELFRKELESKLRELRAENDQEKVNTEIQNIVHELRDVQITKIDQKVKALRKNALAQTAVAVGALAGSVVTAGTSLAATLVALASGAHSYSEYREKVRENPAYFLWKVKNRG